MAMHVVRQLLGAHHPLTEKILQVQHTKTTFFTAPSPSEKTLWELRLMHYVCFAVGGSSAAAADRSSENPSKTFLSMEQVVEVDSLIERKVREAIQQVSEVRVPSLALPCSPSLTACLASIFRDTSLSLTSWSQPWTRSSLY